MRVEPDLRAVAIAEARHLAATDTKVEAELGNAKTIASMRQRRTVSLSPKAWKTHDGDCG
ncbi:hypothetical protein X738_18935 [Mesorhizobium sp. LNHC209A00]|nr:hypothetical protein X741_07535 [Mesorhizobium sp. LNHC229A00]ESY98089.1 hypothetical protein X738_18935 [Mesorhizobium sp. LNHC209A00]